MRERYGLTDVRKAANRMNFNQPEEEYMDGEDTVGLGVLGKEGSGRLRVAAREQKQKMSAKTAKKYAKQAGYKSGLQTSGLASLAFTPVQVRPSGRRERKSGLCVNGLLEELQAVLRVASAGPAWGLAALRSRRRPSEKCVRKSHGCMVEFLLCPAVTSVCTSMV